MALPQQLQHRSVRNTALPYDSYGSPTRADPHYVAGSNVLTSQRSFAELRPGYDAFESTPTTFTDTLTRLYLWHQWDDTFYAMLSTFASSAQHVYVYKQGTNTSFTDLSITNNSSVGAAYPVDFVSSNNTLFMSSGDGAISHKYYGTSVKTVQKWGIAVGEISTAPQNRAGAGANESGTVAWTNPNNVTSTSSFASVALDNSGSTGKWSVYVDCTTFGFALATADAVLGFQVSAEVESDLGGVTLQASLLKGGVKTGDIKTATVSNSSPSFATYTFGGSSDLWGETWMSSDVNATTFGVAFQAVNDVAASIAAVYLRNVQITVYKLGGPTVTVSASAGSMSAAYGYQYQYCYGNSLTGHISSPTPASGSTGAFSSKADVTVALVASSDTQVNQIRVFRTTDGGGGIYFELPNSPFANTTGNITDTATDVQLSSVVAPVPGFNDPPPSGLQGMVWFANRIWGFLQGSSYVYFSGWEEINIGVEEECWPSGTTGNSIAADDVIKALASTSDYLFVFTPTSIHKVEGDSLDTFRRSFLVKNMGTRSRTNVATLGRSVAWLNVDATVWTTDGTSLTEIGPPIRNDIAGIDQTKTSLAFYNYGVNHWLILNDGANSKQYVYDLDTEQWMPPWNLAVSVQAASGTGTVTASGEVSLGVQNVLLTTPTKVLKLNTSVFSDNAVKYSASATTNLFDLVPGGVELYTGGYGIGAPAGHVGELEYLSVETNLTQADSVTALIDDDPFQGVFSDSVWAQKAVDPPLRTPGSSLLEKWWYFRTRSGRRASISFGWNATGNHFKLYSFDITYKPMEQ